MTRDEAIQILVRYAKNWENHRWEGACPEDIEEITRDEDCIVCQALVLMEPHEEVLIWSPEKDGFLPLVPAEFGIGPS